MNSCADDIANYLQTRGIGSRRGKTGWVISVGQEPKDPVTAITVLDTGGGAPDTCEQDIFYPTFLVRVRAGKYAEGYSKCNEIMRMLTRASALTLGGSTYAFVQAETDVESLGKNDTDKEIFACVFRAMRS